MVCMVDRPQLYNRKLWWPKMLIIFQFRFWGFFNQLQSAVNLSKTISKLLNVQDILRQNTGNIGEKLWQTLRKAHTDKVTQTLDRSPDMTNHCKLLVCHTMLVTSTCYHYTLSHYLSCAVTVIDKFDIGREPPTQFPLMFSGVHTVIGQPLATLRSTEPLSVNHFNYLNSLKPSTTETARSMSWFSSWYSGALRMDRLVLHQTWLTTDVGQTAIQFKRLTLNKQSESRQVAQTLQWDCATLHVIGKSCILAIWLLLASRYKGVCKILVTGQTSLARFLSKIFVWDHIVRWASGKERAQEMPSFNWRMAYAGHVLTGSSGSNTRRKNYRQKSKRWT